MVQALQHLHHQMVQLGRFKPIYQILGLRLLGMVPFLLRWVVGVVQTELRHLPQTALPGPNVLSQVVGTTRLLGTVLFFVLLVTAVLVLVWLLRLLMGRRGPRRQCRQTRSGPAYLGMAPYFVRLLVVTLILRLQQLLLMALPGLLVLYQQTRSGVVLRGMVRCFVPLLDFRPIVLLRLRLQTVRVGLDGHYPLIPIGPPLLGMVLFLLQLPVALVVPPQLLLHQQMV